LPDDSLLGQITPKQGGFFLVVRTAGIAPILSVKPALNTFVFVHLF
jgi:hypothetical protein